LLNEILNFAHIITRSCSYRRETARRFLLRNILLKVTQCHIVTQDHSKRNDTVE